MRESGRCRTRIVSAFIGVMLGRTPCSVKRVSRESVARWGKMGTVICFINNKMVLDSGDVSD